MTATKPSMSHTRDEDRFFVIALSVIICCICISSQASAQENCEMVVSEMQGFYEIGRTAEMIDRLNRCLPDGIPEQVQKVQAYRFLSLAYIAEDRIPEAREAVEKLLDINENFEHDPTTDPQRFIEFVVASKEIRAQAQAKKSRKRRLLWIGGGALVAGAVTVAIITSGGSNPRSQLPDPPAFPVNQ